MDVYEAIKQMRQLSLNNIPFAIKYVSLNTSSGESNGVKEVSHCLLRRGYSKDKSNKYNVLVGYTDLNAEKPKSFYLPLLIEFNGIEIQ